MRLRVSGVSEPVPELSEVPARQPPEPAGAHLPEPQVSLTQTVGFLWYRVVLQAGKQRTSECAEKCLS